MKANDILTGFATAAQAIANESTDPVVKASAASAAVLIALVARLLDGRTPDEAKAILETLLKEGVTPITEQDLNDQVKKIKAELAAKVP